MTSSPTAGWLRCRMFTNVEVPPRASSRRVVAVLICGTDALATAIPAALATTAAEATATIAPLPNLRLMWSIALPLVVRGGRCPLPVSPWADTGLAAAPRVVAGYLPMVVLSGTSAQHGTVTARHGVHYLPTQGVTRPGSEVNRSLLLGLLTACPLDARFTVLGSSPSRPTGQPHGPSCRLAGARVRRSSIRRRRWRGWGSWAIGGEHESGSYRDHGDQQDDPASAGSECLLAQSDAMGKFPGDRKVLVHDRVLQL